MMIMLRRYFDRAVEAIVAGSLLFTVALIVLWPVWLAAFVVAAIGRYMGWW